MLETELFSLLEGTADAAFTVDDRGSICSWNRAAEKLYGYAPEQVLHKSCADLFQGRGSLGNMVCTHNCSVLECATAHLEISNYDLEVKSSAGRPIWVNISILVFEDRRTKRRLLVHLCRDISSRKKNEEFTQKFVAMAKELVTLPGEEGMATPVSALTQQEKRVLRLLSEGKSPAQVARALKITPRTLRNHLHHANQKLGTRTRLEAVIHAVRRELI
jgi:PAS domain S-box-containing protein